MSEIINNIETTLTQALGNPTPIHDLQDVPANLWIVSGIEIVSTAQVFADRQLRALWRRRENRRGIPLVLVAPHPAPAKLWVVGPSDIPARAIVAQNLADEILAISALSPRRAAAQLADALDRLDHMAVPGILVHGLLTDHFVERRLPERKLELQKLAETALRANGWRERLNALGHELVAQAHGYTIYQNGQRLAVVHPYAGREFFGRADEQGTLPEGALISDSLGQNVNWGILAAGNLFRIYYAGADVGARTDRWLEIDAGQVPPDMDFILGLLAPESLRADGHLQQLVDAARDFGVVLRGRIEEQIREFALPQIARGLGAWLEQNEGADLTQPEVRREIQRATFTFLFRLLFLLYAESAGHLPIHSTGYRPHAAITLVREAGETERADPASVTFYNRLMTLIHAVRTGNKTWAVHAYNGSLFAAGDLPGADLLERAQITDEFMVPALEAIGFDFKAGDHDAGIDYADLEIGHLGAIYEGLLALELSRATETLGWDEGRERYLPMDEPGEKGVLAGDLFFQTQTGARKGGGVYYTRQDLVRHLVSHSVLPALDEHLDIVRDRAKHDPKGATKLLFDFKVLDPAMGSAHFLVDALDMIADRLQTFLSEVKLPNIREWLEDLRSKAGDSAKEIEDGQLLRRLVLKHCLYGVDLSEMAVEIARVSLWLASFVPGLSLTYLGHNLRHGDALVGVASVRAIEATSPVFVQKDAPLPELLERTAEVAVKLADLKDRTPDEVATSRRLSRELETAQAGARRFLNCWTAHAFGVHGARELLASGAAEGMITGKMTNHSGGLVAKAEAVAEDLNFFHWPLAFPEVFDPTGASPGFDVVIGNPPWNEVTVEELGFYALHDPGLRALTTEAERRRRIGVLLEKFPHLSKDLELRQAELAKLRQFFGPDNGYALQGGGDVDVYQLFCERYTALCRPGGYLGVVLPRSAFLVEGARGFRRWLFRNCQMQRIAFLLNNRSWAFPIHPQYTIALLAAKRIPPVKGASFRITGPSASELEFAAARKAPGVPIAADDLAEWTPAPVGDVSADPSWEVPLLPSPGAASVFAKVRQGPRFDQWAAAHGGIFPVREMDETNDRKYFRHKDGFPVWKGRAFDQYDAHGRDPAGYVDWDEAFEFLQKKRLNVRSAFRRKFPPRVLSDPATHPIWKARLAFRDVSRATDSRTVRAGLVPPRTFLTNTAPYLVFPNSLAAEQAFVIGILNSLPFDWQARRFVETHLNYFVLDLQCLPTGNEFLTKEIARRAARLSCPDERFADFAAEVGVDVGPLTEAERAQLKAEIDALVALAYRLNADDLETVFADFTSAAVPPAYRDLVREKFAELAAKVE